MRKVNIFSFTLIAIMLASCSVVKNPQSSNFKRVKYNSHLKLVKSNKNEKLPVTVNSFKNEDQITSKEGDGLEKVKLESKTSDLVASNNAELQRIESSIKVNQEEVELKSEKKEKPTIGLFGQVTKQIEPISVKEYLNKPIASSAGEVDLGNLLYIILVVLLVLIVIGLVADLAGGLVGALIAVLLILLILRLLGYI